MTSRTLVSILDQTKYREEEKNQRCGRKRVKQAAALIVVLVIALTCAILSAPNVTAPAKPRQISARYTHSESLAPEDREVLDDIRTSFVPTASIVIPADELPRQISTEDGGDVRSAVAYQNLVISDLLFGSGDKIESNKRIDDPREKREAASNLTNDAPLRRTDPNNITVSRETWETSIDNDDLDQHDYLEQEEIRVESQIEDGAVLLNSFQSFWRGEDDAESIRKTQSEIMRQYMDLTTDPCVDFYQYACGNWAPRNPIPADKAGYDTFEILRENLDIVLRDLLNSKNTMDNTKVSDIINNNVRNDLSADQIVESDKNSVLTGQSRKKRRADKFNSYKKVEKRTDLDVRKVGNKNHDDEDAELKAKYLYDSCMNYEVLERRGLHPLLSLLETLGGWPAITPHWNDTQMDWLELMARLRLYNNDILVSEWVGPDIKNSDEFVIQFDQTSLGLPTRDYFLQPSNQIYLEAYKFYLIKICTLMGSTNENAAENADDIINFEIRLAKITSGPEDRRNVTELYRRMSLGELTETVPKIDWQRYLSIVLDKKVNLNETVVIFALKYMQELVLLLEKTESRTIANYLLWRFVRHRVNNLDDRFQEAKQKFYYILFGREQAPSRWKNCVAHVNSNMGMALGSMFVKKHFNEKSKNDTLIMTREIQHSFRELLNLTAWIDDETKLLAGDKVDSMVLKIGYPGFILNNEELNERYKSVEIRPDTYFENTLNMLQHLTKIEQARLGQPVDKAQWNTAPAVVNAYYSRNKNQIMFPAGILQPPFYHRHFPRSLNYGGIGVVIGHEITHGFDDKGRLFDKHGNIDRWWHDVAIDMFHKKAQCLIDQYGLYTVPEVSMTLDGFNTQGENIADNGGIKQAFRAYRRWLQKNGDANETLPGLNITNTQLFFLNFAQIWCGTMRPEAIKTKLKTATHSPGKFRVIGTLSNSDDFAKEYKCTPGSPMNPIKKCNVW